MHLYYNDVLKHVVRNIDQNNESRSFEVIDHIGSTPPTGSVGLLKFSLWHSIDMIVSESDILEVGLLLRSGRIGFHLSYHSSYLPELYFTQHRHSDNSER